VRRQRGGDDNELDDDPVRNRGGGRRPRGLTAVGVKAAGGVAVAAVLALLGGVVALVLLAGAETSTPNGASPGMVCAPAGWTPDQPVAGFSGAQLTNAAAIVATGVEMGVPPQGQVIAVATAMQESRLRVLANSRVPESLRPQPGRPAPEGVGSDHDSVGPFRQPGGWGPLTTRMDPRGSARLFYGRLLGVRGWQRLPLWQAAQTVQGSDRPWEYDKWQDEARQVVGAVRGVTCPPGGPSGGASVPHGPMVQTVIDRAMAQLGTPYVWGGGDATGPTRGVPTPTGRTPSGVGFDCSGLMVHAFAGIDIAVPHQTKAIWNRFGPPITDRAALMPGDMILLSNTGRPGARHPGGIHHVGLYLGHGQVLHAPQTGSTVSIVDNIWSTSYWSGEFIGAVRAIPHAAPQPASAPLAAA
jgi:cell wall-associated NlpC family hydrolase